MPKIVEDVTEIVAKKSLNIKNFYLDPNNYRFADEVDGEKISSEDALTDKVQKRTRAFIEGEKRANIKDLLDSFKANGFLKVDVIQNRVLIKFDLKNVGKYDGAEVVQLYIGDPISTVVKPIKELKKFKKVFLSAGEEKKIEFEIFVDDFSYFNIMLQKWTAENGVYDIYIGSSSQDIRLKGSFVYCQNNEYTIKAIGESMIG